MRKALILIILCSVSFFSCTKKHNDGGEKYAVEEFDKLAHSSVIAKQYGDDAIAFKEYSLGFNEVESRTLIYQRLRFFAVKFETEKMAHDEAVRLNQYYSRNMLFDRVEGEPILEDYVITTFQAKNPNRAIQRVPKKSETHETEHPSDTAKEHQH